MHAIVRFGLVAIAVVALALGLLWVGRPSAPGPVGPRTSTPEESVPIATSVRARPGAATPEVAATTATIAIPEGYALLPGLRVAPANSWEELLAGLDPEQRALAEAFASRYPEAYRFASAAQLAWMVERGYPMPEEITAAEAMRMDELMQLASSGNVKAMMLAVDRGARENEAGGPDPDDRERNAGLARRPGPLPARQAELRTGARRLARGGDDRGTGAGAVASARGTRGAEPGARQLRRRDGRSLPRPAFAAVRRLMRPQREIDSSRST